jgi:hypothetical protein
MMKRDICIVKSLVRVLRFGDREGPAQPRDWSGRPSDHLRPACCFPQAMAISRSGRSSRSGIRAMLSAEYMRRPSSCQCSCCSRSTAPTKRMIAGSLGKMPTTLVRRLMERVADLTCLCDFNQVQQVGGQNFFPMVLGDVAIDATFSEGVANMSSLASWMSAAALGKRSASEAARSSQRDLNFSAVSWAITLRRPSVTIPRCAYCYAAALRLLGHTTAFASVGEACREAVVDPAFGGAIQRTDRCDATHCLAACGGSPC